MTPPTDTAVKTLMCDHPNRETAMVVLREKADGQPAVWCDPCIADLVDALNTDTLATVASCCGHGLRDGSIVLADGRELTVRPDPHRHQQADKQGEGR